MNNIKRIITFLLVALVAVSFLNMGACSKKQEQPQVDEYMKEKYTKFWHAMWDDFPEGEGRRETLGKYEYIIEEGLAKDLCFYNYSCDKDYSLDTIKAFFEENPQDKAGIDELVMDFVDWITVYKDKKFDEYDKFGRDFAVFYNELTQTQEGLPKYSDLTAEQIMAVGELYRGATNQLDLSVFGLED